MISPNTRPLGSSFGKRGILFYGCTMIFWGATYVFMPILAPYAEKVGGSLQAAGLVIGAYGLSQFLFRIPLGLWSDWLRRRKPFILLGFLFQLGGSLGLIFSTTTGLLFLSVFAVGIASSMWVAFTVLFSSYFPLGQVAQSLSFLMVCVRLSQIITIYAGGAMAQAWGWTATFYAGAVLSLLGFFLAREIAELRPEPSLTQPLKNLFDVGRHPQLLWMAALCLLLQFATLSTTFGFTPIYAQQVGASKGELGLLLLSYMVSGSVGLVLSGTYSSRWLSERGTILAGFLMIAGSVLLTPFCQGLGILYFIQGVNGMGAGLLFPLLMSLAIQPFPLGNQATAMGFFQSLYALGMTLGPVVSGWIGDRFGLPSIFFFNGVLCLLGALFSGKKIPRARGGK